MIRSSTWGSTYEPRRPHPRRATQAGRPDGVGCCGGDAVNDVASFELCSELFKLSRWKETADAYDVSYADHWLRHIAEFPEDSRERAMVKMVPAYPLGYLLRKLPPFTKVYLDSVDRELAWRCVMPSPGYIGATVVARGNTPEDAAVRLAISLFRRGVLS